MTHSNVKSRDKEVTELEANYVSSNKYSCELCEYTTQTEHGLSVHKGHKHKIAHVTPEKERSTYNQADISLTLTPTKEPRKEQCRNCGLEMSPEHQCEEETDDSTTQEDQELQTEEKHCEKCNFTFVTIDHFRKHVKSNHSLGPKCWEHCLIYNQRIIYPEKCSEDPGKCCLRASR